MTSRASDRFISVTLSVLLHGSIVGLLVYGWWRFQHRPQPVAAMAIDATVVPSSALHPGSHSRAPASAPAAAVPPPPPPPPPAPPPQVAEDQAVVRPPDTAARERAAQEQAARDAAAQHDAELKAQKLAQQQADELAQQQAREQAAAQQAQVDARRKAQEAARAAREEAERKTREEAERKAKAEADRLAKIEAAKQAAEQKRRAAAAAASQADLQRSLAEEEHFDAARASGAMATWEQQIQARIQQAWIRPPSARPGISCTLLVTQVPGGEITNVTLGSCNGDEAVRESIETAAYRASPLPPPPDPSLFERNLEITFKPTDQ